VAISLKPLLSLDRMFDLVEHLKVNQPAHVVSFGETLCNFQLVLGDTTDEIICHADVKRAADPAGENVNVEAARSHLPPLEYWIARSSRAMTVGM
jgi:hypothetical protein